MTHSGQGKRANDRLFPTFYPEADCNHSHSRKLEGQVPDRSGFINFLTRFSRSRWSRFQVRSFSRPPCLFRARSARSSNGTTTSAMAQPARFLMPVRLMPTAHPFVSDRPPHTCSLARPDRFRLSSVFREQASNIKGCMHQPGITAGTCTNGQCDKSSIKCAAGVSRKHVSNGFPKCQGSTLRASRPYHSLARTRPSHRSGTSIPPKVPVTARPTIPCTTMAPARAMAA